MQRNTGIFLVENVITFKQQMLNWANQFGICCFMDSHNYSDIYSAYDCLLAADAAQIFTPQKNSLAQLKTLTQNNKDWLFGNIGYDLKNEVENLTSSHLDRIGFSQLFFFQPETVLTLKGNELTIASLHGDAAIIYQQILQQNISGTAGAQTAVQLQSRTSKALYIDTIKKLQQYILRGDCYEINFCQEFFVENATIDPLFIYQKLLKISPTPFSVFYKVNDKYALCASPERYLKKQGEYLISQPIKGTIKRNIEDANADDFLKNELLYSAKNRSENVMIADLVRNDLSKLCKEGSVQVKELFGIYTYPQVHQMITTIQGEVDADINFADVLEATFPMGSMTGAPKRRVMELIETYETTARGLFSGSIGYITPDNNFDFNVVIRSILYNAATKYISCPAGGAITFYSDAEEEFEECLLKAKGMQEALKD